MIKLENVTKAYPSQSPITFECHFGESGFYAVMGQSGCGKTTLLNILAGLIPFDGGTVVYDGEEYTGCFSGLRQYDYITQDSFFLDFVSVYENLKIVKDDPELIKETLDMLGMSYLTEAFPPGLSGGERQRLAIARALISGSPVIILDEPTASLDRDSKTVVFEAIKRLSESRLVICATHDADVRKYADSVLNLKKQSGPAAGNGVPPSRRFNPVSRTEKRSDSPYIYIKKWYDSAKYLKKAGRRFFVVLAVVFCVCLLADYPSNKFDSTMEMLYSVNYLRLSTMERVLPDELPDSKRIAAFNIVYSDSVPSSEEQDDGNTVIETVDYELAAYFIPDDPKVFKHLGCIEYGYFFTDTNQVVLSYDYAENLSPGDHSSLVGTTMSVVLYGAGSVSLEVTGVLRKMNENEMYYFRGLGLQTDSYFINYRVIEPYESDPDFCFENGQRAYNLFFKNFREARKYLKKNGDYFKENGLDLRFDYTLSSGGYYDLFTALCAVLLPMSFIAVLLAVIFSTATFKTELIYNGSFLSVLDYMGFSRKQLKKSFAAFRMKKTAASIAFSLIVSLIIGLSFNALNRAFSFIPFQVFTFTPILMAAAVLLIAVSVLIATLSALRAINSKTWYANLTEERDLL